MIDILHQKPLLGRQINWAHPLAKGLVGCWLFNEGSGNKVFDIASHVDDLGFVNSPIWTLGKNGPAILFDDGDSEYLISASSPVVGPPFTLSAWANTDDDTNDNFAHGIGGSGGTGIRACIALDGATGDTGHFLFGNNHNIRTTNTFTANTWHHICGIAEDDTVRSVYLDADIANKGNHSEQHNLGVVNRVGVGALVDSTPAGYFSGRIDLPMIWNRILSEDEVIWLFREPYAMFQQNRVRWFSVAVGAALFASIADTVGITDTTVTKVGYTRNISDNIGLTDILSKIGTYIRTLADNLASTDTINTARNLKKSLADDVGITDTITTSKGAIRSIADTVGITDVLSKIGTYIRNVVDSVGITDVLAKIGTYKRSVADTTGITDTTTTSKGVIRSIADSVGITDVLSALVIKVVSISDTLGITDTITTIVTAVISPFVDTISGISKIVKSISIKSGITKSQSKESKINKDTTGKSEL